MTEDIQLSNLHRERFTHDVDVSDDVLPSHVNFNPTAKSIQRKLVLYVVFEAMTSLFLYYKYTDLISVHRLLAPMMLGASSAALAQSINQYMKKKFSLSKVCKFIVWGLINGSLTVLWVDMLMFQFENTFYRIATDQIVGAPCFQLIYNILSALWDTGEISGCFSPAHMKSFKYSYCFWPFFSVCAFIFLPQSTMFPAYCLANLVWNLILSKLG
ncbi:hypothetical protein CAAN1_01S12112 [[Candida] anglica]|uniref:Uncharacterized protein n=1 Tax=[Candida] anglica TaxID=148631 RepID=A0ABP0EKU4_9ASCO